MVITITLVQKCLFRATVVPVIDSLIAPLRKEIRKKINRSEFNFMLKSLKQVVRIAFNCHIFTLHVTIQFSLNNLIMLLSYYERVSKVTSWISPPNMKQYLRTLIPLFYESRIRLLQESQQYAPQWRDIFWKLLFQLQEF